MRPTTTSLARQRIRSDRVVTWKGRSDTSAVRGPIRIHGVMRDADLYSLQFRQ